MLLSGSFMGQILNYTWCGSVVLIFITSTEHCGMAKTIPEYVKYTTEELDNYRNASGSCVKKISATLHLNVVPFGLNDLNKSLLTLLSAKKIGSYEPNLKGIILDIHNVKLLGNSGGIRFDDPKIHLNINSDCYIFKPFVGAVVKGTVRHVSSAQIGVNIYRVFSVSIRLVNKPHIAIEVDSEINFRIKKYCLESTFPFIEGELVKDGIMEENPKRSIRGIDGFDNTLNIVKLIDQIKKEETNDVEN